MVMQDTFFPLAIAWLCFGEENDILYSTCVIGIHRKACKSYEFISSSGVL